MNASQKKTFDAQLSKIIYNWANEGDPEWTDYDHRTTITKEGNTIYVTVECKSTNPELDDDEWYWAGDFGIGPRGKLI